MEYNQSVIYSTDYIMDEYLNLTIHLTDENVANLSLSNETNVSCDVPFTDPYVIVMTLTAPVAVFGIIGNIVSLIVLSVIKPKLVTNIWLKNIVVMDTLILVFPLIKCTLLPLYLTCTEHGSLSAVLRQYVYPWAFWLRLSGIFPRFCLQ